jgi:hypothetical protein
VSWSLDESPPGPARLHNLRDAGEEVTSHFREQLERELVARGYSSNGDAPNGTMNLDRDYLNRVELVELMDQLISRREKIFKSGDVVGLANAKLGYEDVVIAIDALKAVISRNLSGRAS